MITKKTFRKIFEIFPQYYLILWLIFFIGLFIISITPDNIAFYNPLVGMLLELFLFSIPFILVLFSFKFKKIFYKLLNFFITIILSIFLTIPVLFFWSEIQSYLNFKTYDCLEKIKETKLNNFNIAFYETNCGATTDYGVLIKKEEFFIPGIIRTENIYSQYHANNIKYNIKEPNILILYPENKEPVEIIIE